MKMKFLKNQISLSFKSRFNLLLFSLCFLTATTSFAQSETVSFQVQDGTLAEVFQQIENQTSYRFFYEANDVNIKEAKNVSYQNAPLSKVLQDVLNSQNLSFKIVDKQIVLKKGSTKIITAQSSIITGTIKDKDGMPLVGVNVLLEGSNKGTLTNFDGEYELKVRKDDTALLFTYLGFKTERIELVDLQKQQSINLVLTEDTSLLEEVLLIGYGEQKREDVSGAVSSVKTDDIVQAATGNVGFDRALGGLVKGVQVSQNSGRPGSPIRLNIRGVTSPLSAIPGGGGGLNQPLYVIDGVPFNRESIQGGNPLLSIDPNNIKSFDILKDAAATSIYGSRGANGVVLIETKKGQRNEEPAVSISYTTTLAEPINTVDVLDASQYRDYNDQLIRSSVNAINSGQLDPFFAFDLANVGNVDLDFATMNATYNGLKEDYFGNADTNWNDVIFRNAAVTKKVNFNLRGGTAKTNYSLNFAHTNQEGLVVRDRFEQYNIGMSLNTDVNEKINVGGTLNLSHNKAKSGEENILGQYTVNTMVVRARPDLPVRDENGQLLGQTDYSNGFQTFEPNPLMRLQNDQVNKSYNFIGNTFVEVEPVKKLKLRADVNASVFYSDNSTFIPQVAQTDMVLFPTSSLLSESTAFNSNVVTNLTANYNFRFNNHNFNLLAGYAWDYSKSESNSYFYSGFPDDEVLNNPSSAENLLSYDDRKVETGLNSFFSRLTYNYENKYNATINFRTDASSKFGSENKRAYFPSLSAAWNVANEDFLKGNDKVNFLKLRASIGRVGSTNVADFAYLQFFNTSASDIYNGSSGVIPDDLFPNEAIKWEETEEINIGLDFEFFKSRLRGSVDAYSRKTTDALAPTPIPLELGPDRYYSNYIDLSNKGVEVSLGGDIIRTEDFKWSATINWAFNRNKLDKFNGANINQFQQDYYVEGEPVGTIKGYQVDHIIQDQEEIDALNANSPTGVYDKNATGPGDYLFKDINGDGRITTDDRTVIGDIEPDYFGGISTNFQYKNFSLSAFFQYSVGAETIWDAIPSGVFNTIGTNKYSEYALNTWTPNNRDAKYARAVYFDPSSNSRISDRYLFDSSYLRLKSVQLSYTLDTDAIKSIGLDQARLTLTGNNLATWTKWPGLDPETFSNRASITSQTNNEDPYPLARSFSLGVQVQF